VARAHAIGQLGYGRLGRAVSGLGDGSKGVGVAAVAGVGAGHYPQLRQPAKAHASSVRRIAGNAKTFLIRPCLGPAMRVSLALALARAVQTRDSVAHGDHQHAGRWAYAAVLLVEIGEVEAHAKRLTRR